ncbi:DUF1254 domain-containing protein [Rhizobium johnstonii]|uniref:DUF1254 domain-containing protein n=1 Tax=Rhizobium johnstonii TaxID=3019933 RepID=UPI003F9C512C
MTPNEKSSLFAIRRRDLELAALALAATALLAPRRGIAANMLERSWDELTGELKDLPDDAREAAAYFLGMESYVFGYPLVMMDVTRDVLTAAPAPNADGTAAPINQLAKMPTYVSPDFKNVVRISLNSLWTTGWLDLENDPIVLSVPDTKDRYYVFSIMNMWTDVFGSAGKRTTGTSPGHFLIVGPNWKGTAPADIKETFRSSTRYAWALGQTQANGPEDFAAVNAIQAGYKLTPLSAWGKPYTPPKKVRVNGKVDVKITPPDQVAQMDAGTFFNRLATAMKDNPPYAEDTRALKRLHRLGIEPGKPFDISKVHRGIAAGLQKAVKEVQIKMAEGVTKLKNVNGWINMVNLGRYGTDYNTRAGVAYMGLGADMCEDTVYPTAYVDGDGHLFDSANAYVMRFEKDQLPPTNGTWSVSQYKGNFYERNILDRYAIAPWMPLQFNPDGSLDIYLQATSPGKDKESNWLPTPLGQFNLTLRNYFPERAAYDGSYKIPPVKKMA